MKRAFSRRGLSVVAAIALVAIFMILLACMSIAIMEYSRYGQSSRLADEVVAAKLRENLMVIRISEGQLNVTNEGSTPSLIVGIFSVNPGGNPEYQNITPPRAVLFMAPPETISLEKPVGENWLVGVVTSYGNVFWEEEATGGAVEYVPPGETAYVTFAAEGLGSNASGTVLTVDGASYTYEKYAQNSQFSVTFAWTSGSTHSFAWTDYVSTKVTGKRYVWASTRGLSTKQQDNSFTVNANGYIIATYKTQCYLTMQVNPSGGGTVSPGSGWYDSGASFSVSASPSSGWAFERWVGSGSGSYSGTSSSATITMREPITETAYFYTFTVSVSPTSGSVTAGGSTTATVTVSLTGGYSSSVTVSLSASGLPSGASASFSPSSVTVSPSSPTASSAMTIATSTSTPTGTYTVTIKGSGGGLSKTTIYTLTIEERIWLTWWQYRIPITVTSSQSLSDYQVLVKVDTASLISAGKMRSDCGDIRFTDSDGQTLLPYWIEPETINSANTRIWVKVPSVPSGTKIIYMYYGNPSAASQSNGGNVFMLFDDFSGFSLDTVKWIARTTDSGESITVSDGVCSIKAYDYYNGKHCAGVASKKAYPYGKAILARVRINTWGSYSSYDYAYLGTIYNQYPYYGNSYGRILYFPRDGNCQWDVCLYVTGSNYYSSGPKPYENAWFKVELRMASGKTQVYLNDQYVIGSTKTYSLSGNYVWFGTMFWAGGHKEQIDIDWVAIRQFAGVDPTVSLGSEEHL